MNAWTGDKLTRQGLRDRYQTPDADAAVRPARCTAAARELRRGKVRRCPRAPRVKVNDGAVAVVAEPGGGEDRLEACHRLDEGANGRAIEPTIADA